MTQELKALDLEGRFMPPGEVISDRFKLGEKIGEGPFGQVYQAKDTLVEAEVAVKVFDQAVTKSPVDEERFLKATRRARALTQKNVVRLHDSGIHKDHPWVSMQFLDGLNLRKVVRLRRQSRESFRLDELEPILSQITLALQHVGRDYPHGNLKPENVIFLPEFVKVTDNYVLAALADDVFAKRLGDERFIAPELRTPGREPDPRCDVYSVGMLIGFMLFGDDYRPGDESDAPGSLAAVDTLCRRATTKDPAQRYSSVEALNEDFTAIIDTGSLLTSPSKPVRPPGAEPIPETEETVVAAAPKRDDSMPAPADMAQAVEASSPQTQPSKEKEAEAPAPSTQKRPAPSQQKSEDRADRDAPEPKKEQTEEKVDPLNVETAPDISTPPAVDEAPTAEFDRKETPPELQDLLPTEEVEREQLPPRQKEEESSDDTSGDASAAPPRPASSPGKKAKPSKDDDGPPVGIIAGAGVVVALFLGVVILALVLPSDEADPVDDTDDPVAEQPDDDEVDEAAVAEAEKKEERQRQKELEELRKKLQDATAAASEVSHEAFDTAQDKAKEEEERIEEEEEEEAEAVAGAGAAPGGADPGGGQPAAAQCPSGMARFTVAGQPVCIDTHQYPGPGQMPRTDVSWFDARSACQSQGKRLCELQEWQAACGSGYPYGASFNPNACNTADADGFDRSLAETGSFSQCRSHVGAYDMSGNVHEWVEEQRVVGGAFDSGPDMARCDYSSAMSAGNSRANVGFRCCADPG